MEVTIDTITNRGLGIARVEFPPLEEEELSTSNAQTEPKDESTQSEEATEPKNNKKGHHVIMVPFVIPGEVVKVRIFRNFPNYSEADLIDIVRASPNRIEPLCPLAGQCGGCQLQHMTVSTQREWKKSFVQDGLEQYEVTGVEVSDCLGTDETFGYRSKLTPHYQSPSKSRRGRKNVDADDSPEATIQAIGFQKTTARQILGVLHCPIGTPAVNIAYQQKQEELLGKPSPEKKKKGQRWKCTQEELSKSNINISIEFMQDACPQLFRLPTELQKCLMPSNIYVSDIRLIAGFSTNKRDLWTDLVSSFR